MISDGRKKGIEFVLPVDFVIPDGTRRRRAEAGRPAIRRRPEDQRALRAEGRRVPGHRRKGKVAFHNGVFGMFEDPRFEGGTTPLHPAAQADDRQPASKSTSAAAKAARPSKNTAKQTGSPTSSPPAAPCSTPWAANPCRTWSH